jgi:hypothetical protein
VENGFVMQPSIPAARHASMSRDVALAVTPTIGVRLPVERIARAAWKPSSSGIWQSISTAS